MSKAFELRSYFMSRHEISDIMRSFLRIIMYYFNVIASEKI